MNRRLEIDISSDREQQTPPAQQHHEQEDQEEEEVDEEEQEEFEDDQQSQYSQENRQRNSTSRERQGLFESVQTFGNQQPSNSDRYFIDRLIQPHLSPNQLNETPIGQRPPKHRHAENSSLEDQIARIISKVNRSHGSSQGGSQRPQQQSRIGVINKQLLKENTSLISEINELESKLEAFSSRKKSKKGTSSESLPNRLQKYKEKLSKALALNSKLSARLNTERSRSNAISNTFRSILNQASTLRSHITKGDFSSEIIPQKSLKRDQQAFCQRCCREMKQEKEGASMRSKEGTSRHSRQLMFSPVLQVKNYEIAGERSNQFQLPRKQTREVHCQVNFQESASLQQMHKLQEEERSLQDTIEANNRKILEYEQLLYQLVDLN